MMYKDINLSGIRVILASRSPRRRELLSRITESFEVETRDVDENLPSEVHPREGVAMLAVIKGEAVANENPDALVISSDTLVEVDGTPLGKPQDGADAYRMLRLLSGRAHNVHTGVAVHYAGRLISGIATSAVRFRELTDDEIWEYIRGGEPMDKAGSYRIQGEGGRFVECYDGDFDTIMGLSVSLTAELVRCALGGSDEEK